MTNERELIIECGVDGGVWTLVGTKGPNDWCFRAVRDEGTLFDLMNEEDRADFESYHETEWVSAWEAALALFDKYPWHRFCPVRVHPDFARRIWAAVQHRFDADKRQKDDWSLRHRDDWHRLCHGGGRASAYSDFLD
jgi:hypothetical protein